jgi:hypothetical protein
MIFAMGFLVNLPVGKRSFHQRQKNGRFLGAAEPVRSGIRGVDRRSPMLIS